ncbi:MAG: hypothetical protein ACYTKD_19570 [Planctomycetota bacterium]|jgi:hypothetical protein
MTKRATGPAGGNASGETRLAQSAESEERIAYLATGFALGALETAELRELYDALREKGDAGRSAASTAWKVLGLTVDLRATLGTQLQDTVAHRVEAMATGADEQGEFVDRFRSQMGIARPRLAEVEIPGAVRRGGRIALIAALALGAVVAVALLLARRGPERIARVGLVRGTATVEGSALAPGVVLDRRPVIVGSGGLVELEWPDGHEVTVEGPANLVPQGEGLSLSSGTAWVAAGGAFTVGLPDGRARLEAGSVLAVEVAANRSVLGVSEGSASLTGEGVARAALEKGRAAVLPDGATGTALRLFRWQREAVCRAEGATLLLEREGDPGAWRFEAVVIWGGSDGSLSVRGGEAKGGEVRLAPGAVVVAPPGGSEIRHELRGAPLLPRRVEITTSPGRAPAVRVEGLAAPLPAPFTDPPAEVRLSGSARLASASFHTGPPPAPRSAK